MRERIVRFSSVSRTGVARSRGPAWRVRATPVRALLQVVRELRVGEQVRRPVARPRVVRQVDLAVETAQTHLLPVRVSGLAAGRRDVDQPIVIERVANVGVQWVAS